MYKYLLIAVIPLCVSCGNKKTQERAAPPLPSSGYSVPADPVLPEMPPRAGFTGEINDFMRNMVFTNAVPTGYYSVPPIRNIITGIEDSEIPWTGIEENAVEQIWGGIQILLRADSDPGGAVSITAENGGRIYTETVELTEAVDYSNPDTVLGFYANIPFENKFWLGTGREWKFSVRARDSVLAENTIGLAPLEEIFCETIDDTPFRINTIKNAQIGRDYIFRCSGDMADIVVVYYSPDYSLYEPVVYLIPETKKEITDIGFRWNSAAVSGVYIIKAYPLEKLPAEEQVYPVFEYIAVGMP
ncbi:hypothetical protein [Breznakiella homolactica]|uniref:Uncharacterized protein n=1 Tax=Breznakiella homolactica TaxID=2798577 RepID=A0A7T8BA33_9SPIR|nr:hypothetical protein [Breznakiella homolactica]QQO10249.1 hypothetical protein JFL75_04840 [Breznakiella homolactica]